MWWIIGAILAMSLFLFVMSLCRVASDADDQMERIWYNMQAERAASALAELADDD